MEAAARLAQTRAQTEKTRLESDALRSAQNHKPTVFDYIARFGGAATSLVAVAGLITSGAALFTSYLTWANSDREKINELLAKLGSTTQSERFYALSTILNRDDLSDDVENSVYNAVINEASFSIKIISAEKMIAKKYSTSNISTLQQRMAMFSMRYISEIEDFARKRDGIRDKGADNYARYDDLYKNKIKELESNTDSIVTLAYVKSKIECLNATCPLSVSGIPFKRYTFMRYPFSLAAADFTKATIWGVDFAESQLDGTKFGDAIITTSDFYKTSLKQADFRDAKFIVADPEKHFYAQIDKTMGGRSLFNNADLTDAVFEGACLIGTDFRHALGLRSSQFEKSFNKGALFPAQITQELTTSGFLDSEDSKCASYDPNMLAQYWQRQQRP